MHRLLMNDHFLRSLALSVEPHPYIFTTRLASLSPKSRYLSRHVAGQYAHVTVRKHKAEMARFKRKRSQQSGRHAHNEPAEKPRDKSVHLIQPDVEGAHLYINEEDIPWDLAP